MAPLQMLFIKNIIKKLKQSCCEEKETEKQQDVDGLLIPEVDETAILEYLDILKTEYSFERDKKQSFESRAGGLLALLGAICIFYFQNIDVKDLVDMFFEPLTLVALIRIIAGVAMIISLIVK